MRSIFAFAWLALAVGWCCHAVSDSDHPEGAPDPAVAPDPVDAPCPADDALDEQPPDEQPPDEQPTQHSEGPPASGVGAGHSVGAGFGLSAAAPAALVRGLS